MISASAVRAPSSNATVAMLPSLLLRAGARSELTVEAQSRSWQRGTRHLQATYAGAGVTKPSEMTRMDKEAAPPSPTQHVSGALPRAREEGPRWHHTAKSIRIRTRLANGLSHSTA